MDILDELLGSDRPEDNRFLAVEREGLKILCIGTAIIWVPLLLFFLAFLIF